MRQSIAFIKPSGGKILVAIVWLVATIAYISRQIEITSKIHWILAFPFWSLFNSQSIWFQNSVLFWPTIFLAQILYSYLVACVLVFIWKTVRKNNNV